MTMTAAELNRKLAEALGYQEITEHGPYAYWVDADGRSFASHFSPATSSDDLRLYVYPELKRRNLWAVFLIKLPAQKDRMDELLSPWPDISPNLFRFAAAYAFALLTEGSSVLAAAALKALEGGE